MSSAWRQEPGVELLEDERPVPVTGYLSTTLSEKGDSCVREDPWHGLTPNDTGP